MSTSEKSTSDWLEVLACEGAVFILIVQPCKFPNDTLGIEHALVSTTCWETVFSDRTLYICSIYDDCVGFERTAETAVLLHVCPFIASKCFSRPMTCTLLDQFFRHSTVIHLSGTCCSQAVVRLSALNTSKSAHFFNFIIKCVLAYGYSSEPWTGRTQ